MPEHGSPAPSPRPTAAPCRVIALINQKGGVGKTTTTVNLGAALASLGHPTLIVDLDPQAHATLSLGVDPATAARSVYDLLLDWDDSAEAAVVQARPNLSLVASETDLAAAETELAQSPDRHKRLARALAPLLPRFRFILIDCPPSLGMLTLNGLAAAREVIIPMQAHFLALQGVSKLLETVNLVRAKINPDLSVSGVVVCMHDAQASHTQEVVNDLVGFFDAAREQDVPWRNAAVFRPPIRRNIKLAECPSFGQTIFDYAPGAPGAADYKALAEAVIDAKGRANAPIAATATATTTPECAPEAKPSTPSPSVKRSPKPSDTAVPASPPPSSPEPAPVPQIVVPAKSVPKNAAKIKPAEAAVSPGRWRRARRAAFVLYVPVLLTLTLWPNLKVPGPERSDLWAHLASFGLLASLLMGAGLFGPPLSWRNIAASFAVCAAFGAVDEWIQAIPFVHRTCALDDWEANVVGITLACIGAAALRRFWPAGVTDGGGPAP